MDTYEEAAAERERIAGLLEDPIEYSYRSIVLPLTDEEGNLIGFAVGVAWVTQVLGDDGDFHEYGNMMAVEHAGAPVEAIKSGIHHSYTATMADLGL